MKARAKKTRVLPLSDGVPHRVKHSGGDAKLPISGLQDAWSIMSESHSKRLQILQQVG
ncbi:hypothetical protein OS11_05250 [Dickeya oryzae]